MRTVMTCTVLFGLFVSGAYELWNKKTHTHTCLTALCPGLPGWVGARKVKPIWILLKQDTVSGSGISWAVCKSAPRSRQITTPAPHLSVFYRPDALSATQPTVSKHWRHFEFNLLFFEMRRVDWIFLNIWCTRITVIGWSSVWQMRWKETWRVS